MAKAARGDPARQSLFSRQLKELEEFFGSKLSNRIGKNVVLTEKGIELAAVARATLTALQDHCVHDEVQMEEFTLAAGESVISGLVIPNLSRIRERFPSVVFSLINQRSADAARSLIEGRIDFAVISASEVSPEMESQRLGRLRYMLVVPKDALNRESLPLTWKQAASLKWIGLEGNGSSNRAAQRIAQAAQAPLRFTLKCPTWAAVAEALTKFPSVAFLPELMPVPEGYTRTDYPSINLYERDLVIARDRRRGSLRPKSIELFNGLHRNLSF